MNKDKNRNDNENENEYKNDNENENNDQTEVIKGSNNAIISKSNDVEDIIYHNSPLRKTKENEEEIERHRKSRKKSGRAYNKNEVEEVEEVEDGNFNTQGSDVIQISMPLFLLSMGAVSILSYLVGKSSKS